MFTNRQVGKTLVTRTTGTKIASEGLKGRVIEASLADLNQARGWTGGWSGPTLGPEPTKTGTDARPPLPSPRPSAQDEDQAFRKIKLRIEDVQGKNCLTNFWGMDFTTDKLRSLVRKWQTLIEASADVKTTDGFMLRIFAIAFTKRRPNQVKRTAYAQTGQVRQIRKKMVDVITHESAGCDLKELVQKFIPELIGKEIEKACGGIFPLQNTHIRKVKIMKAPKLDITKLMEVHGDYSAEDVGARIERPAEEAAPIVGDD